MVSTAVPIVLTKVPWYLEIPAYTHPMLPIAPEHHSKSSSGQKWQNETSMLSLVLRASRYFAILEGVFKSLMKCWFDSSNHGKAYYLGMHREAIDRIVARVKPPRRTPQPINTTSYWKTSEYHSWLLYFAVPILKPFLLGCTTLHY